MTEGGVTAGGGRTVMAERQGRRNMRANNYRGESLYRNGIAADSLEGVTWVKSRHSDHQGNCVELAELPGGAVALRNSRYPQGPALIYTRAEISAFVSGAKDDEFASFTA